MDDNKTAELTAVPQSLAANETDVTKPTVVAAAGATSDPMQGEGDRVAAKKYDDDAAQFIAEGKVPVAAREARAFVDADPAAAAKAERDAKRGPGEHPVEDLVEKGRALVDKVVDKVKHAIHK